MGWLAVIFVAAVMGILLQCGVFTDHPDYSVLNYYTLMSNILCAVYYLPAALWACRKKGGTLLPQVKGTLVMCIIVTGMVYQFFLAGRFEMQGTLLLSNMLLHYVVPVMTVLDWILFDKKGYFKRYSPFLWVIAPVAYFIYVNIRVAGGAILGPYGDKYPYYFMDYDKLGVPRSFLSIWAWRSSSCCSATASWESTISLQNGGPGRKGRRKKNVNCNSKLQFTKK